MSFVHGWALHPVLQLPSCGIFPGHCALTFTRCPTPDISWPLSCLNLYHHLAYGIFILLVYLVYCVCSSTEYNSTQTRTYPLFL